MNFRGSLYLTASYEENKNGAIGLRCIRACDLDVERIS